MDIWIYAFNFAFAAGRPYGVSQCVHGNALLPGEQESQLQNSGDFIKDMIQYIPFQRQFRLLVMQSEARRRFFPVTVNN